ncbi:hypothetical protein KC19_7G021500 [Ceratodon purpureus]|uniref:Gamma-secretase subunit PEN-2 n=1 Tax=Ceratodon purpureus TaxID=3225 RepID=A0A8T0H3V3_CERPU|nr:hypothetical protein KC19_7G021500 [Ceratodon purpureus]
MADGGVDGSDMEVGEGLPRLQYHWPTVDGALGVYHEQAVKHAKWFFYVGFLCLPWLWFINCFYFWPVLRNSRSDPMIRPCTLRFCLLIDRFID